MSENKKYIGVRTSSDFKGTLYEGFNADDFIQIIKSSNSVNHRIFIERLSSGVEYSLLIYSWEHESQYYLTIGEGLFYLGTK